uniref:40S ribosomal protein S7 n=1 Tax=Syphacia muris TaxID=451379 RepID=A0A0N5ANZ0_9BILA
MTEELTKIVKSGGKAPTELEKQVSNALADLEATSELKSYLRELYIVGAREIELGNRKCLIIFVPVPQLRQFQKIQPSLVRELEKKFSGTHVVFIARRRSIAKPKRGKNRKPLKQKRPRSRTYTAVHDAILADLVFPAEVVGRRIRVKLDGKRIMKVHLDKNQQTNVEHKVDTFASIYKQLTGKEVTFEFPDPLF